MTSLRRALALLLPALFVLTTSPAHATAAEPTARASGGHVYQDFTPQDDDPAAMRRAWRAWQRLAADHYVLRVHNSCFCLERPPVETTVVDGEVTSVTYQGGARQLRRKGYDLDRVFLILRDAYAHADRVDVRYSTRGVPYRMAIDWDLMAADEEANYTVKLRGLGG
jgi:hypothetical protein